MARWFYVVDLRKEWASFNDDDITLAELVDIMTSKLRVIPPYHYDKNLKFFVDMFSNVKTKLEFITYFNLLGDWGDQVVKTGGNEEDLKLCWLRLK